MQQISFLPCLQFHVYVIPVHCCMYLYASMAWQMEPLKTDVCVPAASDPQKVMQTSVRKVAVIGAGLGGLAATYHLLVRIPLCFSC